MSGYEAARLRRSRQWQTGFLALLGALLALPALAGEPAPPSQSDDPAVAAALRYEHGEGVARNPGRAAEMYCAAAHRGNADAAYRLGWMYANGDGVERDDRQAAALFQRAASLGHGPAARMLEGMQMSDARMPLCMSLAPPPRIAGKSRIDIRIRDLAITVDGDVAKARFVQEYRADRRRESALKTLTLIKSERTWLIRQEESKTLPPPSIAR